MKGREMNKKTQTGRKKKVGNEGGKRGRCRKRRFRSVQEGGVHHKKGGVKHLGQPLRGGITHCGFVLQERMLTHRKGKQFGDEEKKKKGVAPEGGGVSFGV